MQSQISSGTIYAPNWNTVRVSKLAARMYAPLGTRMTLGDHVRVTRVFADAFSGRIPRKWEDVKDKNEWGSDRGESVDEEIKPIESDDQEVQQKRDALAKDLGVSDSLVQ
jgi:glycerol-3-phosphate O-acyltransferase / dihydroxyacetone phosphate acyltransferase